MNANELTFGVEIETTAPITAVNNHGLRMGGYHHGIQVPYLPAGWKAESDCSIRATRGVACEIVSPILRGEEGLRQVLEVIRVLKAKGHHVNESCGVHVHVGFAGDAPALARLITMTSYAEAGLFAITGTKKRERGRFTAGIKKYGNAVNAKSQLHTTNRQQRYHLLNLTNLAAGKPTVEFRVFSGSLNPLKVLGWIQVCLGLVERAINGKKMPAWSPKPLKGGWKKAGVGASETERLLGFLAWSKGAAAIHGGKMFGWLGVVDQEEVKKTFRQMAAKYDAMA